MDWIAYKFQTAFNYILAHAHGVVHTITRLDISHYADNHWNLNISLSVVLHSNGGDSHDS